MKKKRKSDLWFGGIMHSYGFKLPDFFLEYGPIAAKSADEAKAIIRKRLGLKRLPSGIKVWDLAERPIVRWKAIA
jgi:hypothetical protein